MNLHLNHNVLFGHLSNIQALEFNLYEDSWQNIIVEESVDCGAFHADSRLGDAFLERRNTSYTCYTWQTFLPRDQLSPGAALVYGHHPEWFWGNLIIMIITIMIIIITIVKIGRGEEDHDGCWSVPKSFKAETGFSSVCQFKLYQQP